MKRQELREREIGDRARELRSRRPDGRARRLCDAAVLHARRTGALARAAHEAEIQMIGEALVQLDAPFGGGAHEMDAPARRLRFDAEHAVRRAGVETQPAVNALVKLGHVQRRQTCLCGYVRRLLHATLKIRNSKSFISTTPPESFPAAYAPRRSRRAWEIASPD